MPRIDKWKPPTAADVATWPLSKLLACYVQVIGDPNYGASFRALYGAEIDRRFPVPEGK